MPFAPPVPISYHQYVPPLCQSTDDSYASRAQYYWHRKQQHGRAFMTQCFYSTALQSCSPWLRLQSYPALLGPPTIRLPTLPPSPTPMRPHLDSEVDPHAFIDDPQLMLTLTTGGDVCVRTREAMDDRSERQSSTGSVRFPPPCLRWCRSPRLVWLPWSALRAAVQAG